VLFPFSDACACACGGSHSVHWQTDAAAYGLICFVD
jgi:hypothetical protein